MKLSLEGFSDRDIAILCSSLADIEASQLDAESEIRALKILERSELSRFKYEDVTAMERATGRVHPVRSKYK